MITESDLIERCREIHNSPEDYCGAARFLKEVPVHLRSDCCNCEKDYREFRNSLENRGIGMYCTRCGLVHRLCASPLVKKCEVCHKKFIAFPNLTTLCKVHDVPTKFTSTRRTRVRFS